MYQGRTVFTQLLDFLPRHTFRRLVKRYRGDHRIRSFSCWDQFLAMAFAQLTYRESLRDIEACLGAIPDKLYHLGFRSAVSRSTLADANEKRDWRIYADFAQVLIAEARHLYAAEPIDVDLDLDTTVYALDSTTVDLCLDLFPWARFQEESGALKLHTLLDLRGPIPAYLWITDGRVHDVNILDVLAPEPGSIYIFDRGYIDFLRLYRLHQARAIFVTRAKKNVLLRRLKSHPVDRTTGLFCDQTVVLTTSASRANYPAKLRRVRFKDPETGKAYTFLTNDFTLPALTIVKLYKCRWQIELFFKWIKQHLRIKSFYGRSPNAVKTQIWIAISVYVLVAIVRKRLGIERDLYTLLQILSVILFEKVPLQQALAGPAYTLESGQNRNQLQLFDL
jgi:hypothetical protein